MNFWVTAHAYAWALVAAGVATPCVFRLLKKFGVRHTISEHVAEHAHKQGTPTMGGIIIVLGWLFAMIRTVGHLGIVPILLVAAFAMIGFLDDFLVPRFLPKTRGLGWKEKLILQVGLAVAICYIGTQDWRLIGITSFMILFGANAYNFTDGLDALAGTIGIITAAGLGALCVISRVDTVTMPAMAALIGALIPFLFLNAPPARVFMGDVGSLPIGALFGYAMVNIPIQSSRLNGPINAQLFTLPLVLVTLTLFVELIPVPIQILSVKLFKRRVFPRTPIHHAFQMAGWPETRIVWFFALTQLILTSVGVLWMGVVGGDLR